MRMEEIYKSIRENTNEEKPYGKAKNKIEGSSLEEYRDQRHRLENDVKKVVMERSL